MKNILFILLYYVLLGGFTIPVKCEERINRWLFCSFKGDRRWCQAM